MRSTMAGLLFTLAATAACRVPSSVPVEAEPGPRGSTPDPASSGPAIVELAIESSYGCALLRGGEVHCWGDDPGGLLGLRDPTPGWTQASRIRDLPPAIDIGVTVSMVCAVVEDGRVICWGPDADRPMTTVEGLDDVVEVDGGWRMCARSREGRVACWGRVVDPIVEEAFTGATRLSVGGLITCVTDEASAVWCWAIEPRFARALAPRDSEGDEGLLGSPLGIHIDAEAEWRGEAIRVAVVPELSGLSAMRADVCVRTDAGMVWCSDVNLETIVEADAVGLATGHVHGCILTQAGEVTCFGDDEWAQFGNGASGGSFLIEQGPDIDQVVLVAASRTMTCAHDSTRGLLCWGTHPPSDLSERVPERVVHDIGATHLVVDGDQTCVSTSDAHDLCWGEGTTFARPFSGEGVHSRAIPTELSVGGARVGPLVGLSQGCLLDPSHALRCGHFVLDVWTSGDRRLMVESTTPEVDDVVVANWGRVRCILSKSKLDCAEGRRYTLPVAGLPRLKRPTQLSAVGRSVCVLHGAGEVSCFGLRDGDDRTTRVGPEARVELGRPATHIVGCGEMVSNPYCALDSDGGVWCWTVDYEAAARSMLSAPVERPLLAPAIALACSEDTLCALASDGRVQCQGHDAEPRWEDLHEVVELDAGTEHVCARHRDGTVTCFGDNELGQLGALSPRVLDRPAKIEFVGR